MKEFATPAGLLLARLRKGKRDRINILEFVIRFFWTSTHVSVIDAFMDLGEEGGLFFSNKLKRSARIKELLRNRERELHAPFIKHLIP